MTNTVSLITVYPTKASALVLIHPSYGRISANGSDWPKDAFTVRRLKDGSITTTKPTVAPTFDTSVVTDNL